MFNFLRASRFAFAFLESQPNCLLVRLLNAYSSYIIFKVADPTVSHQTHFSDIIVTYGKAYAR